MKGCFAAYRTLLKVGKLLRKTSSSMPIAAMKQKKITTGILSCCGCKRIYHQILPGVNLGQLDANQGSIIQSSFMSNAVARRLQHRSSCRYISSFAQCASYHANLTPLTLSSSAAHKQQQQQQQPCDLSDDDDERIVGKRTLSMCQMSGDLAAS
jgi:hypothetical protein